MVPHFQGPFLWELLGTGASPCLLHLPTSHTQLPSSGVSRPRMAASVSRSCMLQGPSEVSLPEGRDILPGESSRKPSVLDASAQFKMSIIWDFLRSSG